MNRFSLAPRMDSPIATPTIPPWSERFAKRLEAPQSLLSKA